MAFLLVTACATKYKPQGFGGGYSSTRLDENVFQVSFRGNAVTSATRAKDFTMLRSAELALQNGFKYFIVLDSDENIVLDSVENTQDYSNMMPSSLTANMSNATFKTSDSNPTYTTKVFGGETYRIRVLDHSDLKPHTSNTIICYKEKPEGFSYNAESLAESIRQKYD